MGRIRSRISGSLHVAPMTSNFTILNGEPTPLGPQAKNGGVNFALFSAHATSVTLCLYSEDGKTEIGRVELPGKTGDVWHGFVKGLKDGQHYGYRVDGPYAPSDGHRFNANKLLIDPYAKNLLGEFIQHDALYGFDVHAPEKDLSFSTSDSAPYMPKSVVGMPDFDWMDDEPPGTDWADTIIYEAHVKGLTKRHPDIPAADRGTLTALSNPATIAHFKKLGVTAIEFLPLQSYFSEPRLTEMGLTNYWGYNPVNFFAPHAAYLGPQAETAIQQAVKSLHAAEIEVLLDVVYNHTAESWELGPTLSFRGIDNASYYHLADDRRFYVNHTGCGNTLNMAHPHVLELTIESLRYWVEHMHFDGFRFDLAPTLARNPYDYNADAPFFDALRNDPVLSKVKLIAEPWDIGPGGYVLGQFPSEWAEWNDRYRDTVRSFWRGDDGAHQSLAGALLGSAETFDHNGRPSSASVNLITAHDGFNLHDTVAYNEKHNYANGEENRDGHGHNLSDNMGFEGETDDPNIITARRQRKKNMLATLMLSQGTPMLLAGDEFGHTQHGNNNAYCQDNDLTWLDWDSRDEALETFTGELIALRKAYPHFTQPQFLHGSAIGSTAVNDVEWLSPNGDTLQTQDWENSQLSCLGLALSVEGHDTLIVAINRGAECEFHLTDANAERILSTSTEPQTNTIIAANSISVFKIDGTYLPPNKRGKRLDRFSKQYGILPNYRDINGTIHHASPATKTRLLEALGVDLNAEPSQDIILDHKPTETKVYGAEMLRAQGGCWGVTAALYALKSSRNAGVGDFEDLAQLAETMASKGADFIGINPVHALFPAAPHLYAPYSPSSRQFLNVMLIAIDKLQDLPKGTELSKPPETEHIDYAAVYSTKMSAFDAAFEAFSKLTKTSKRKKAFEVFVKDAGTALQTHALFDAIFETLPKAKQTYDGWQNFPKEFGDPESKACRELAKSHKGRVEFYAYLQWIARDQLMQAQSRAVAAGMRIGIYLDFAVGVVPGGSGVWRVKAAFAEGVSLGAPGDMANPDGQLWNLAPFNPHELARNNLEPYRFALREAMSLGGAIRIDHILGHLRSFWIPENEAGGYVRYPFDGLLNMIAEESQTQNCVVFGEDLGTVPDGFRDRMRRRDLMGCNVALIERDTQGRIIPKEDMRELSITAFSNHDFPTLTGYWNGEDFKWREQLGIGDDPDTLAWEKSQRKADKRAFLDLIGWHEGDEMNVDLMADLQAYLAGSNALAFAVQLDDLMLEPLQANVPGTTDEQPNWRRRTRLSLQEIAADKGIDAICKAINDVRKRD